MVQMNTMHPSTCFLPELNEQDTFSVSEIIQAEIKQHYLFYMNAGSNVTISACFVDDAAIIPQTSLYISRGIDADTAEVISNP